MYPESLSFFKMRRSASELIPWTIGFPWYRKNHHMLPGGHSLWPATGEIQ